MDSDEAGSQWQDPSNSLQAPYHDQGFIDVPFEEDSFGLPESVEDLLEMDLGNDGSAMSAGHPSRPRVKRVLKLLNASALYAITFLTGGCACAATKRKNMILTHPLLTKKSVAHADDKMELRHVCGAGEK
ncbi:unnamed protein product [Alternaria alternata]